MAGKLSSGLENCCHLTIAVTSVYQEIMQVVYCVRGIFVQKILSILVYVNPSAYTMIEIVKVELCFLF